MNSMPKIFFYWQAISRWALILFAGLMPIFFLPFTGLPVAANKELLAFVLILLAFFALLGKILVEGKIRYPGHLLAIALAVLVLVWGVSAFFSLNQITSLIGSWATPDSFASILLFTILTFGVVMTFDRRDIILSLLIFLASLSLLGVFELLQLFKIYILPFDFAKAVTFNPVGSVNNLGVLLAFGLVIASGLMSSPDISKLLKRLLGVSILVLLLNLIVIDFWAIWAGLVLAMIFMISFLSMGLSKSDFDRASGLQLAYFEKAWLPSIVLLVSLLLLIVPSPLSRFIQTPAEVSPNFNATLGIAFENLKAGHYLVGSGPNTFGYIFNLYKPAGINQTIFWSTVFNSGASAMATWAGTVGILGILALLFLIVAFVWTGIKGTKIRNSSRGIMNVASQAIFVAVTFLFIMWFLYAINFTILAFVFWGIGLFLAASLFFILESNQNLGVFKEIKIFTSPPRTFLFSLLIVGLMVVSLIGIYFEANRYVAEIYFGKAVTLSTSSGQADNDATINNVSRAINFWPYDERYFQGLSQAVFIKLNALLTKKDLSSEDMKNQFQNITTSAIAAARQAQSLNPENPFNLALLGSIYENLIPFIADASSFALSSYSAAVALDPKNPDNFLALARVEVAQADLAAAKKSSADEINGYLDKAVANLEESLKLKDDYAPARFLEVQIYDRQGKSDDAIRRAEELVTLNANDVGSLFQLGFLYYKANRFDDSRQVFEELITLSPNYSNARYFLGLIYDRDNPKDKTKAIEQFQKISELNPDNNEIKLILKNLKAGKPALFGIAPPAPAPQNRKEAPVLEGAKTPVKPLK
jgi:tetratricopeptide (TPR) repeat protein